MFCSHDHDFGMSVSQDHCNPSQHWCTTAVSKHPIVYYYAVTGCGGKIANGPHDIVSQRAFEPCKVNIMIKNIQIKDPVVVDLLSGKIYEPKPVVRCKNLILKRVLLADYPMVIVGKAVVIRLLKNLVSASMPRAVIIQGVYVISKNFQPKSRLKHWPIIRRRKYQLLTQKRHLRL